MVQKGGKRGRRGKKRGGRDTGRNVMIYNDDDSDYAVVTRMLGNGRIEVLRRGDLCKCLAIIRGKLRGGRRNWISIGDLVLVGIRSYQEDKCDVLHKYDSSHIQILRARNDLPESLITLLAKSTTAEDEEEPIMDHIEFRDDVDDPLDLRDSGETAGGASGASGAGEAGGGPSTNPFGPKTTKEDAFEFDFDEI